MNDNAKTQSKLALQRNEIARLTGRVKRMEEANDRLRAENLALSSSLAKARDEVAWLKGVRA